MKNGKVISFIVNILTGILFSFPVFSAQSNLEFFNSSSRHFSVSITCSESETDPEFEKLTVNKVPEFSSLNNVAPNSIKRSLSANSGKKIFPDKSPPSAKYQLSPYFLSDFVLINSYFVNLPYLKDLRTTKMLC